jgi:hypothetical protein
VDNISTPQPSQSPQNLDEAKLKDEQRNAHRREYQKLWLQKKKEDPVWLEQHRIREKKKKDRRFERINKDEVLRDQYLDNLIKYNKTKKQKIKEDPVRRERLRARKQEFWRRVSVKYGNKRHDAFRYWFSSHKAVLDTLTWKRWSPIYLKESVDKVCAACGTRSRRGSRRLWFVRKSDPELWDCLPCFSSSDMSEIVPVEGAERFYRGQYLQPHPTATEGAVDHADTQEAVDGEAKDDDVRVSEQEHLGADEDKSTDRKTKKI